MILLQMREREQSAADIKMQTYLGWRGRIPAWAREETQGFNSSERSDALGFLEDRVHPKLHRVLKDSPDIFSYYSFSNKTFGDYRQGWPTNSDTRDRSFPHTLMLVNKERLRRDGHLSTDLFHVTSSRILRKTGAGELIVEPISTLPRGKYIDNGSVDLFDRPRTLLTTGRVGPELLRILCPDLITLADGKVGGYAYTDLAVWKWPEINKEMWESLRSDVVLSPENADRLKEAVKTIFSKIISWKKEKARFGQAGDVVEEVAEAWRALGVLGFWQRELATPSIALALTKYYSADDLEDLFPVLTNEMDRYISGLPKNNYSWQKRTFPMAIHTKVKDTSPSLYMFTPRPPSTVADFIGIRSEDVEHIIVDRENIEAAKVAVARTLGEEKAATVMPLDEVEKTIGSCEVRYPPNSNETLGYYLQLLTDGDAFFVFSSTGRMNSLEALDRGRLTPEQRNAVEYGLFHIMV